MGPTERLGVRQLWTGVILPSGGHYPGRYNCTHLHFGLGRLVLLLGLEDLLHEATCSSSRGNGEDNKNPFQTLKFIKHATLKH